MFQFQSGKRIKSRERKGKVSGYLNGYRQKLSDGKMPLADLVISKSHCGSPGYQKRLYQRSGCRAASQEYNWTGR
jgi:hypothetical protein